MGGYKREGRCGSCGADIYWVKTKKGKWAPIDRTAIVLMVPNDQFFDGVQGYVSHFATCPNASNHRKTKRP